MTARFEQLVYFPAKRLPEGTLPAHYWLCRSRDELRECIAHGGIQTDHPDDWRAFDYQEEMANACYL